MAGDWIKMRSDLLTHPKVVRMASMLKVDRLRTIGALFAVWCLFDAHSEDGTLPGYSDDVLNDMVGLKGCAAAMRAVNWLQSDDNGLTMPEFGEHNGKSAKVRAEDSKRKRIERTNVQNFPDKTPDRPRTDSGPEKRREEKKEDIPPAGVARTREADAAIRMKSAGLQAVNPSHPKLIALLDAGITVDELAQAAGDAVAKGKNFAYALATAEGRRRDAAVEPLPDRASITVPSRAGPDPALARLEADRQAWTPPAPEVKAMLAETVARLKGATA
mgnify:CR=1 FL=1